MSKERELLNWALIFLHPDVSEEASNLHKEIEELLARPEQEQATPRQGLAVAKILEMALYWMKELKFVYAHPDYDYEDPYLIKDINELEELLAQPEQEPVGIVKTIGGYPDNSQHTVELTGRHGDLRDGDLLYKAPPKSEPLSEGEIFNIGYKAGFAIDHVESDDGESTDYGFIDGDGYIDNDLVFKFVRWIEKAHGIGE